MRVGQAYLTPWRWSEMAWVFHEASLLRCDALEHIARPEPVSGLDRIGIVEHPWRGVCQQCRVLGARGDPSLDGLHALSDGISRLRSIHALIVAGISFCPFEPALLLSCFTRLCAPRGIGRPHRLCLTSPL